MKTLRLLALAALATLTAVAAFDPFKVIPELTLNNCTVLRNVQIVSFSSSEVMAKWEGGRGTITNTQLPPEVRTAVARFQPAPPSAEKKAQMAAAQQERAAQNAKRAEEEKARREAKRKETRKLSGEIFIATRGGANYRLGALQVYVLTEDQRNALQAQFNSNLGVFIGRPQRDDQLFAMWEVPHETAASAVTDADGKFTIDIPGEGNFWIFAQGKRAVYGPSEFYVWLLPIENDTKETKISLNNLNQVSYQGLFH